MRCSERTSNGWGGERPSRILFVGGNLAVTFVCYASSANQVIGAMRGRLDWLSAHRQHETKSN